MLPVNNHFTMVIGMDVHFTTLPPYNPFHPYVGMVLDPSAYIPFIGSTVNVNGVPRGLSDTPGILMTLVHIPLFTPPWLMTPIIGHESINFFASQNVFADGNRLAPKGYMIMTCNDTGVPLSLAPGKKKAWKITPTLFAPTAYSLPVPSGPPVNVGGPYIPDWGGMLQNAAVRMGFMGVMKGLNKVVNKVLKGALGPNWLSRSLCHAGFEPVNFVNGAVVYDGTDFSLPGSIPFEWKRSWYSDSVYEGLLGHGCHLQYDREIQYYTDDEAWGLRMADGRVVAIPELTIAEPFYLRAEKITVTRHYESFEVYHHQEDLLYHFSRSDAQYYKLTRISRQAAQIEFIYDGSFLTKIIDTAGREIRVENDRKGRIISATVIVGPLKQHKISYTYDEQSNMTAITDAMGQSTEMVYENHLMVKKTDRNGQSFYWEYDQQKRCIHTWGDGGWQEGWLHYFPEKGHNRITDATGAISTYYYNDKQLVTRIVNPIGGSKIFQYTPHNELYREIDEDGNLVAGYDYNEKGFITSITYGDQTQQHYLYTQDDNLMISISPGGKKETYFYYEGTRLLRAIVHPDKQITQYTYTAQGLPATIKRDEKVLELYYDRYHNLIELHGNGKKVRWNHDLLGEVTRVEDSPESFSNYEYDQLGRVTRITSPNGNIEYLKYNAYDDVTQVYRQEYLEGAAKLESRGLDVVKFDYTPLGSLQRRTQGEKRVLFDYDRMERLTKVINEHSEEYTFTRNTAGHIIAEKGFDGITKKYQHSNSGRVTSMKGPGGMDTRYRYNGKGQLSYVDYADGTWETYSYNKEGQLISAHNEQNRTYLERDDNGRIITEKQDRGMGDAGHAIHSEYDKNSLRTRIMSDLGADIIQNYDTLGQLNHIQAAQQEKLWEARITRNAHGQATAYHFTGGVENHFSYDEAGRPINHIVKTGLGRECYKRQYVWNTANHLRLTIDDIRNRATQYHYDALHQLVSEQKGNQVDCYKNPDAVGNLYETLDRSDRKYENGGRLTRDGKWNYYYDTLGNLVLKTPFILNEPDKLHWRNYCWRYTWNANGTLKWVVDPDGRKIDFEYDALGRRTAKITSKTITRYLWDGNVLLHEWSYPTENRPKQQVSELGEVSYEPEPAENVTTWVYDEGSYTPIGKLINGERYSIVSDYIGRPVQCFDDKGEIVWETDYDIYGRLKNLRGREGSDKYGEPTRLKGDRGFIPFRQMGQYEDEHLGGLYYNRFRYYDSTTGLYLSQDPIGLHSGQFNFYAYVVNSNSCVDIFGLECWGTARKKFWKQEAKNNPIVNGGLNKYSKANLDRMVDGKAPRITVEVFNPKTMRAEIKDVSMELHHTYLPQRGAGEIAHEPWNLTKSTPWGHEAMDPHRQVGADLIRIIKGTNSW